jgi:hypothetical protein
MRLFCFDCHKPVTNKIPDSTIFRAVAICPECVEKEEKQDQLKAENERLHSENERLLEGLQKIYDLVNGSNTEYAVQLVITMQDEAQQALNEVTK